MQELLVWLLRKDKMFNLLPNEDRDIVKGEYKRRLLVVALLFIFAGLIASLILLLPSVYLVYEENTSAKKNLGEYQKKPEISSYSSISAEVKNTKTRLSAIKTAMNSGVEAKGCHNKNDCLEFTRRRYQYLRKRAG